MEYSELRAAVAAAQRQQDSTRCFALIDEYIATAAGEELGLALALKADYILMFDGHRALVGLSLVNEALQIVQVPHHRLVCMVSGLALCHLLGDTERALTYEVQVSELVRLHGADPLIQQSRFRLCFNLGALAMLRREPAAAYWHFVQGVTSVLAHGSDDETDVRRWLFTFYIRIVDVCLEMNRLPEAKEFLDKAETVNMAPHDSTAWRIQQAAVFRQQGRNKEAENCLNGLTPDDPPRWLPAHLVVYYLECALLAQDMADLRSFHTYITKAETAAVRHSLDYLLARIQRIQREPMKREVTS